MEPAKTISAGETADLFQRQLRTTEDDALLVDLDRDGNDVGARRGLAQPATLFTVQRNVAPEGASPIWKSPDPKNAEEIAAHAAFIDSLEDEEHLKLVGIADWLNFTRAISQAERKIASGQALLPLRKRQAETLLKPVEMALRSLTSSVGIVPPSAAPATKP